MDAMIDQALDQTVNRSLKEANLASTLTQNQLSLYWCPSQDQLAKQDWTGLGTAMVTYFGVMGAGRYGNVYDLEDGHCGDVYNDGIFYPFETVSIKKISDGTSQTIAIGERNYSLRGFFTGAFWQGAEPYSAGTSRVCSYSAKNMRWGITTPDERGYYVQAQDFPVGGKKVVLFNDLFWGSEHPGIAQFAYADGSVHGMSDSTSLTVMRNLATRNGGEIKDDESIVDQSGGGSQR